MSKTKRDVSMYDRGKGWEVVMSGIFSNWANVYFLLFSLYVMLYCTDNLYIAAGIIGFVITITKVIDAVTDPIIGRMIDNSKIPVGKYRIFKFIGLVFMALGSYLLFAKAPQGGESVKILWVLFTYLIWVAGYSFTQTAFFGFNAIITNDPKQRQTMSMFSSIMTLIIAIFIGALVPKVLDAQGVSNIASWRSIVTWSIIASVVMYAFEFLAIKRKDRVEYYQQVEEPIKLKDVFKVIGKNIAHRQLIIAATTNKLANGVYLASASYFYIYVVQDLGMQGTVGLITIPIGMVGAIIGSIIANKVGQKEEFVGATWYAVIICVLAMILNPFSGGNVLYIIILMTLFSISNTLTSITIHPMISACVDYEKHINGRYIPSTISASYSFVEKFAMAISSSIAGGVLALVGYKADMEPTKLLTFGLMFLIFFIPLLGHLASLLAMKTYPITKKYHTEMIAADKVS